MEDNNSTKDNLRLHVFSIGNQDLRFIHRSADRNVNYLIKKNFKFFYFFLFYLFIIIIIFFSFK